MYNVSIQGLIVAKLRFLDQKYRYTKNAYIYIANYIKILPKCISKSSKNAQYINTMPHCIDKLGYFC